MTGYGATPQEWAAAKRLAKADLLPVVSNPHAKPGKFCKIKKPGKVPSLIIDTADGPRMIGFKDWTEHQATVPNLEAWASNPDHGICIQTRRWRALDIDVPDPKLAWRIAKRFCELVGCEPPRRFRADSGKMLFVFEWGGDLSKRSFVVRELVDADTGKITRWLVELLATGQQFIACGTHPDGARYEWEGGFPKTVPEIDPDTFWPQLTEEFSLTGEDRRAGRRDPTLPEDLDIADPVAEHLIESEWPTFSCEHGKLYVECPGKHLHSSDNGETETAWMLAGTGQFRNGHFKCLHESCRELVPDDNAFFAAVGYQLSKASDFEDVTVEGELADAYARMAPGASPKSKELKTLAKMPLPGFNRDGQGKIETSLENIYRALNAVQASGVELAFDAFRGELVLRAPGERWRPFGDSDGVKLRATLEALGFKNAIGKELMRDALEWVGSDRQIDLAQDWLDSLPPWDGVSRVARFWPDYIGTKDTPYTRALGLYSWTAQAARILEPGCQVDMVPVMVSPEGYKKTSVVAALAPSRDFFSEFNLQLDDDKLARQMRGCLVGELAELRGISVRDGEAVKSWITRRAEEWTPKFKEYKTKLLRRCVFYGTTNHDDFLKPHMGKRRWLPVNVPAEINLAKIERDRDQLWAEARAIFDIDGICWERVQELAVAEREEFEEHHEWAPQIGAWLDDATDIEGGQTPRMTGVTIADVLTQCLGLPAGRFRKADEMGAGEALKACGMKRVLKRWLQGKPTRVWVDASSEGEA